MTRRVAHNVPAIVVTSVGLVVLVAVTLSWLGLRLISQEETLDRQRLHDRLEQAADTLLAGFLRTLADTESWLAQTGATLPAARESIIHDGGILVLFSASGVQTLPERGLPYLPVSPAPVSVDPLLFLDSEVLEFQAQDLPGAVARLVRLTTSEDDAVRAEAWLRLARVQGRRGHITAALEALAQLHDVPLISSTDAPYSLASRFARLQLLARTDANDTMRTEAAALLADLEAGRFPLGKDSYAYYESRTRELGGLSPRVASHAGIVVSEIVERIWDEWQVFQRSGSRSLTTRLHDSDPIPVVAVVNASPERLVALIYTGESIRAFGLDPSGNGDRTFHVSVADAQGAPIFGARPASSTFQTSRTLSAAGLPWQLTLTATEATVPEQLLASRRMIFAAALGGVVLIVAAACYAMARGVLREAAASQLQSDFVSAVSHEFRSPLTTLRQLTELLAQGRVRDETRRQRYFDVLHQESLRLQLLVENLLDFGRMDAGRRQYQREPLDLAQLVRDSIDQYRSENNGNGHHIEFSPGGTSLIVDADREAMTRVVRNLIENAVKYSPDAHTVWVDMTGDARAAVLRVRDQGIGIPREEQARIFDKFVRGEGAKRACIPGTGVGLAMVKEIVQMHQGEVGLSSEVGRGSTFEVRLPLRAVQEVAR